MKVVGNAIGHASDSRIFDKMDIINIITNTYSCSIKDDTVIQSTLLGSTAQDSNKGYKRYPLIVRVLANHMII